MFHYKKTKLNVYLENKSLRHSFSYELLISYDSMSFYDKNNIYSGSF